MSLYYRAGECVFTKDTAAEVSSNECMQHFVSAPESTKACVEASYTGFIPITGDSE